MNEGSQSLTRNFEQTRTRRELRYLFLCLIFLIALIPHIGFLENKFIDGSDLTLVVQNPLIRNIHLGGLARDIKGFYKYGYPSFLSTYCWAWIFRIGGLNHIHFHFISYLLHAFCASLLFLLLVKTTRRVTLAFFSTLILALHPLHCEATDWISQQGILMMALLGLLYLHTSLYESRRYKILRGIFLALATILSPLALFFIFAAHLLSESKREKASFKADGVVAVVVLLVVWGWKLHLSLFHHLFSVAPLSAIFMVKGLFLPWDIHFLLPVLTSQTTFWSILVFLIMVLSGGIYLKAHHPSWGFLFLSFLSVWLFHAHAGRFSGAGSYLPLLWISLALGIGIASLKPQAQGLKAFAIVLSVLIFASLGILSYKRNEDWRKTATLIQDAIKASPRDPLLLAIYGHYEAAMRNAKGVEHAFRSIHESCATTQCLKAKSDHLLLRFEIALKEFKALFSRYPKKNRDKYCLFDYAVLMNQLGHPDVTERTLKKIIKMDPYFIYAWNDLGALMIREGKGDQAVRYLKSALTVAPGYRSALENLAYLYMRTKAYRKAISYLKIAYASTSCEGTRAFYQEWIKRMKEKKSFKMATLQWAKLTPPG